MDQNNWQNKVSRGANWDAMWKSGTLGIAGIIIIIYSIVKFNQIGSPKVILFIIGGFIMALLGIYGARELWKKV